jgi:hypothetical protein
LREIRLFKLKQETFCVGVEIGLSCRILGSQSGGYEELYLLGCNAVCSVELSCHLLSRWFLVTPFLPGFLLATSFHAGGMSMLDETTT